MTALQPFNFDGMPVRVVTDEHDEPWFVASDVTPILGYRHGPSAIRRLDSDEYKQVPFAQVSPNVRRDSGPPRRPMTVVNEPGLYSLILWSQKPEAKPFRRWVTSEVLPAIRKTGSYTLTPPKDITVLSPDVLAYLASVGQALTVAVEHAKKNQGKAEAFDQWLNGKGCYSIGTVARMIGVGQQTLFNFLYAEKILISSGARRREPYAKYAGWFEVKAFDQENTNGHASVKTGATPYGAEQIRLRAIDRGLIQPQLLSLTGGA